MATAIAVLVLFPVVRRSCSRLSWLALTALKRMSCERVHGLGRYCWMYSITRSRWYDCSVHLVLLWGISSSYSWNCTWWATAAYTMEMNVQENGRLSPSSPDYSQPGHHSPKPVSQPNTRPESRPNSPRDESPGTAARNPFPLRAVFPPSRRGDTAHTA